MFQVALLAEGVDRNTNTAKKTKKIKVALLAEGVDRNILFVFRAVTLNMSPSSRRAWIEISETRI